VGEQITSAIIQAVATVGAAGLGFGAVVSQMKKQAGLNRQAVLDAESRKLRTEMYNVSVAAAREVGDAAIDFDSTLRSVQMDLGMTLSARAAGRQFSPPRSRYVGLMEQQKQLSNTILRFVFLIENRRIIDERLILFRDVLSATLYDLGPLVYSQFPSMLMDALPIESVDGQLFPYELPSLERFREIEELFSQVSTILNNITAWVEDFLVEIQNLMLGDMFKMPVAHRKPIDPNQRVIKLDSFDAINAWLEITPWGKERARAEGEAAQRFGLAPPIPPPDPG